MNEKTPEVGQLWVLSRGDVSVRALVVLTGPDFLLVWPAKTTTPQSLVVWPALITGVDPDRATQMITRLLPEEQCHTLRNEHRDTVALKVDWSSGHLAFAGIGPKWEERRGLLEQMAMISD